MYKSIIFAAAMSLLIACSTTKPKTQSQQQSNSGISQADVDRGALVFPDLSIQQLDGGKVIYEQYCGSCHGLKRPASESEKGWRHHVPEMVQLTNEKANREEIDAAEQDLILRYLITMSSKK